MEREHLERFLNEHKRATVKLVTADKIVYTIQEVRKLGELSFDFIDGKGAIVSIPYYAIREAWPVEVRRYG